MKYTIQELKILADKYKDTQMYPNNGIKFKNGSMMDNAMRESNLSSILEVYGFLNFVEDNATVR